LTNVRTYAILGIVREKEVNMTQPIDKVLDKAIDARIKELESRIHLTPDDHVLLKAFRHVLTVLDKRSIKRSILNQFREWLDTEDLAYTIYEGVLNHIKDPVTLEEMQDTWKDISADLNSIIKHIAQGPKKG